MSARAQACVILAKSGCVTRRLVAASRFAEALFALLPAADPVALLYVNQLTEEVRSAAQNSKVTACQLLVSWSASSRHSSDDGPIFI